MPRAEGVASLRPIMERARPAPRLLLPLAVAACAYAAPASGETPLGPPPQFSPGPQVFAGPDAPCVGCDSVVPPGSAPFGGSGDMQPQPRHWLFQQLDLRDSSTHGRAMGPGEPLRGTSWLNRPVWVSLDVGGLFMGNRVAPNVRANNDLVGALGVGWDFDHYWGAQARVGWSTPTLVNTLQPDQPTDDNLFISDLSLLYYPWGDSRLRPYYRVGLGLTDVEYVDDSGRGVHDMMFTVPLAVGVKRALGRGVAWRLEFADNIAFGQNQTSTLNNFTITTGFEWRLGGRSPGYWAWAPRSGGW